jgi:hypothetical protein
MAKINPGVTEMRKITPSLLVPLLAASAAMAQGAATERLVSPALPGFVTGHSAANAQQSILEQVPAGESVQAWSRMVTTQRYGGLARRASVAQYVANVRAAVPNACPGAALSPVESLTISGRPAARFQLDCPRNIHVKQVAWRGGTTSAGLAWGRQFLAATTFCTPADRTPACRR